MKLSSFESNAVMWIFALYAVAIVLLTPSAESAPSLPSPGYYSPISLESQNPEYILQTLARLRQALIAEEDLEKSPIKFKVRR